MKTKLVPTPRTNTCLESPSSVPASRRYFAREGGYNHIVLYISNIGAIDSALSPYSFSVSLHYIHVVSGNWNSSQWFVTMRK